MSRRVVGDEVPNRRGEQARHADARGLQDRDALDVVIPNAVGDFPSGMAKAA
jgi:hypothetical protein